jgi:hypothetical protein
MSCDVNIPAAGYDKPGTCWVCGLPDAPPREVSLVKTRVLPLLPFFWFSSHRSCRLPVPVCEEHPQSMFFRMRLFRLLSAPVIAIGCIAAAFSLHGKTPPWLPLIFAFLGIMVYVRLLSALNTIEPFRLKALHADSIDVTFNEEDRAEDIRAELAERQA